MENLIGKTFGNLYVESKADSKNGRRMWNCVCDCGRKTIVSTYLLKSGHTKSCGCITGRPGGVSPKIKGTVIYSRWQAMKKRCYQVGTQGYENYGGRGIKVCESWKNNPVAFYEWAIKSGFSENLTLDRIDVNGDYCPENCRWVTAKEQGRNKRNNHLVEFNGKKMTVSEYSELTGVNRGSIDWRLNQSKMKEKEALNKPIKHQKKGISLGFNLSEECRKRGLNVSTVWYRINVIGLDAEEALSKGRVASSKRIKR